MTPGLPGERIQSRYPNGMTTDLSNVAVVIPALNEEHMFNAKKQGKVRIPRESLYLEGDLMICRTVTMTSSEAGMLFWFALSIVFRSSPRIWSDQPQ